MPTSQHTAKQNAGGAESGGIVNNNAGNSNSTVNNSPGVGVDTTNSNSSIDSNPEASGEKKKSATVLIVLFLLFGGGGFGWFVYRRRGNGPAASKRRADAAMMELDRVDAQNVGMEYTNPIARPSVHGDRADTAVAAAAADAATDAAAVVVGVYYSTVSEVPPIANESAAYASTIPSAYSAPLDGSLPSEAMYGSRSDNGHDGYEMPVGFPPKANNAPIYAIPFDSGEEVAYIATGSAA